MKEYLLVTLYSIHAAFVLAYEPVAFLILMSLIAELMVSFVIFALTGFYHTRYFSYLLMVIPGAFLMLVVFYPQAAETGVYLGDFPEHEKFSGELSMPFFYYKNQILAAFAGVVIAMLPELRNFRNKNSYHTSWRDFILRTFSVMAVCAVALFVAEFMTDYKTAALLIILGARIAMVLAAKNYRRFMWIAEL